MKVECFEELNIYKKARDLNNDIYKIIKEREFKKDFALSEQIKRSSISIISNIAEGFERGSSTEFIQFLFISKGSCGELRAQLNIAQNQKYIDNETYKRLFNDCKKLSAMINNLIKYLKISKYKGEKFKSNNISTE